MKTYLVAIICGLAAVTLTSTIHAQNPYYAEYERQQRQRQYLLQQQAEYERQQLAELYRQRQERQRQIEGERERARRASDDYIAELNRQKEERAEARQRQNEADRREAEYLNRLNGHGHSPSAADFGH